MQELVLVQPSGTLGKESAREAAQADATREFEARLAECGPLAYRVARGVFAIPPMPKMLRRKRFSVPIAALIDSGIATAPHLARAHLVSPRARSFALLQAPRAARRTLVAACAPAACRHRRGSGRL